MFKSSKNEYSVQTAPTDEPEELQFLLNRMASEGWELYTLHEAEGKNGDYQYNCIFYRESEEDFEDDDEIIDVSTFKTKMEKLFHPSQEPYEECKDIQRKLQEKHERVQNIKNLLDSASPDEHAKLNDEISNSLKELKNLKSQFKQTISSEKMYEKIKEEKLTIVISEELKEIVGQDIESELLAQTVKVRQQLTEALGYVIPSIRFTDKESYEANEYSINVRGIPTLTGRVYPGYLMFFASSTKFTKKPKDVIEDVDSIKGDKVYWVKAEKTKDFWDKGLTPEQVIAKNLKYIVLKYVDEIFDYNDVNKFIEIAAENNLYLIENIIPDFLSIGDLRYIFTSLIKERIPIKDVVYIFEKINDFAQDDEKEDLLDKLRFSLNRQISNSIADEDRNIYGITLSHEIIKAFEKEIYKTEDDTVTIKASFVKKIAKKVEKIIECTEVDLKHIALVVPASIRHMLFVLFEQIIPNLAVIANEEVAKEFKLEKIGVVSLKNE